MKRLGITVVALALVAAGACGSDHQRVAYRPVAFGENSRCYYANDPLEVHQLMDAGLCERSWAPAPMPVYWHQMYWPYYSSPAYYNVYVPAQSRTSYVHNEKAWGASNKRGIATEAAKAKYQGSNGKTVTAEKIGAAKYGGGNRFGPPGVKFGGGARTATPTPAANNPSSGTKATPAETPKAPTKAEAPKSKPAAPKSNPPKSPPKASTPKAPSGSKGFGGGSRGGGGFGGGSRGGRR